MTVLVVGLARVATLRRRARSAGGAVGATVVVGVATVLVSATVVGVLMALSGT